MKRLLLCALVLGVAFVLGGCPIYSDTGNYIVCDSTQCYDCPDPNLSGACVPWMCGTSADCGDGYTCNGSGVCTPGAGTDAGYSSTCACGPGLLCKLSDGMVQCVAPPSGADAGPAPASDANNPNMGTEDTSVAADALPDSLPDALFDAAVVGPDVTPDVISDAAADVVEAASPAVPCNADSQCAGAGAKCVDGQCSGRSGLCSDTTQCAVAGEACVDGLCVPHCSASAPCPTGFACDFTRGVCSVNPAPCATTTQCQGGTICVEGHCAAPCGSLETGALCPAGQLCANGGCIPDQSARFNCLNDGESGLLANQCAASSICLHGDCYPGCDPEASACSGGQVCKNVTVSKGTYAVCATPTNLGSDCDPAAGKACANGASCVDGYCQ